MRTRLARLLPAALAAAGLLPASELPVPPIPSPGPAAAMRPALDDLFVLKDHRPAKASFIFNLQATNGFPWGAEMPGDRAVLFEAQGPGSVRHVWLVSKMDLEPPEPHDLEFFVDGEAQPRVFGQPPDLVKAALALPRAPGEPPLAAPTPLGSWNFYFPIPFKESLRVEHVVRKEQPFTFYQFDYRTDAPQDATYQIHQEGGREGMALSYTPARPRPEPPVEHRVDRRERHDLTGGGVVELRGPGIIRRLALNSARPGARLRVTFDNAPRPAVDVDLADFLGPYRGVAFNNNACHLPMPFRESARIELLGVTPNEELALEADIQDLDSIPEGWGYLHAYSHATPGADGVTPHPVAMLRGRGQWVGMHLYDSQHDHGGGDFAVLDELTPRPAFLHGINGEDYFSFSYFAAGENFPYTEAFTNEQGRHRLHLENVYPFQDSCAVSFAVLAGTRPRTVSLAYMESPSGAHVPPAEVPGWEWRVFGPVDLGLQEDRWTPSPDLDVLFAALPDPAALSRGEAATAAHVFSGRHEAPFNGWATQRAVLTHLNLSYVYGHVMQLGGHHHMGCVPRAMMAETTLASESDREATLQFSHDDPAQVLLNGEEVYSRTEPHGGFLTATAPIRLRKGPNTLLVRLADTPNTNTAWAGIAARVLDEDGRDITFALQEQPGPGG